ncbi:heme exporter protein A [Lentzea albidocapillata subsp. violacea]|uniref:Heme exporter protein A n=1 Tax=Lentzea albidocapillata subsp. violacea TaxID=128104 RepID=A0A1G9S2D2_9PSEU|nr:ATP-binding cassette domain-containing protein [Lentzea albidocapillata]SDM29427.1 heme exporter protein A [Lentzea albidocapillata subsp. violacea]
MHLQLSPQAELTDVHVDVQRTSVLRGLDLVVAAGEVLGLIGANGSGKSTLLNVLATLIPPVAGTVQVRGPVALLGHAPALYSQLTLRENLQFVARMTGRDDAVADAALATVGLAAAADRRADRCSHGMRRRADLARVFVTKPSLLLLDEVHTGLDVTSAALVDHVVDGVRRRGGACVVVSHDRDQVARLTDRVVELAAGRVAPAVVA